MTSRILKSIILIYVTACSQKIFCQTTSGVSQIVKTNYPSNDFELQQAIHILSEYKNVAMNNPSFKPKLSEQDFILKFFKGLWANTKVNKKLRSRRFLNYKNSPNKLEQEVVSALIEYTYKSQKNYYEIDAKIKNISQKLIARDNIQTIERLKVRELRTLISLVHLHRLFNEFETWGILAILSSDTKISELIDTSKSANELHSILLTHAYNFRPKRGVYLVAYDFRNDFSYRKAGAPYLLTLEALAYMLNLRVSHFSLAFTWNDTKYESHMWGKPSKYNVGSMPLVSYVYDTYRLKIDKLVPLPSTMKKQFKNLYGDNWLESIEKRLEDIMKKYFIDNKNENFARLYNPELRRMKSIFALDYSLTKTRLEDQIYFSHSGKVTCSEFIAKAILQCIELLNQKIAMDWHEYKHKGERDSPYLKFPIKRARKIKRYSPQEYFDHLKEYDLIEKLETPPLLKKAIKIK